MDGDVRSGGRPANRWRIPIWGTLGALLLAPAAAMRFTHEVRWTAFDFAFAGLMLGLVGGAYELATMRTANPAYRAATAIALVAALLLVWATGAVGLFGDEGDPANLMFGGVLMVGLAGALVAKFRSEGMAWALSAMAAAQVAVVAIALMADKASLYEALLATGFALPWLLSAALYAKAAE